MTFGSCRFLFHQFIQRNKAHQIVSSHRISPSANNSSVSSSSNISSTSVPIERPPLQFSVFHFHYRINSVQKNGLRSASAYEKAKTIPKAKHIGIVFAFAARLQNCEMKSNRAGLGCANPNKVPEDTNSFLTDDAKLALKQVLASERKGGNE